MELLEFLQRMPKVEIHCHLFGTVRLDTLLALGEKYQVPMSREELAGFYVRGEKPKGVLHLLRALDQHFIKDTDDLYRLTYEYLQDAQAHGVRYSEFFWNPTGTVDISGISYAEAQDAIIRAVHSAETDFGILGRLVPAIDREASPTQAVDPRVRSSPGATACRATACRRSAVRLTALRRCWGRGRTPQA